MGNDDCGLASAKRKPIEIPISLIIKAQRAYARQFDAEDSDMTGEDARKARANERAVWHYAEKAVGPDKGLQAEFVHVVCRWFGGEDRTYKPYCDELRKLGFEIKEEGKSL
jgi:hypothetical protein